MAQKTRSTAPSSPDRTKNRSKLASKRSGKLNSSHASRSSSLAPASGNERPHEIVALNARIPLALRLEAKIAAQRQGMTLQVLVRMLLEDHLREIERR